MTIHAHRVRDYMNTDPVTVSPDEDIMRVIFLLAEKDISGVIVVDEQRAVVGILTERDCIQIAVAAGYLDEIGGSVAGYMTTRVTMVAPDDSIVDVAERFAHSAYRRCPVVENGRLVGLICRRNVLKALAAGAWFDKRS